MVLSRPLLPREVSLARIVAQGLVPATSAPDVTEAVRRQLAVQGQQVSAVPHALVVRAMSARGKDADAAFASGALVRSWPMRGTAHVTTTHDHHWLRAALMHRTDAWTRSSEQRLGISDALLGRAADVALELFDERGPVTRAELVAAWTGAGVLSASDLASSFATGAGRRRHLLVRLQRAGILVQGPRRGNEHLVVDARHLPGADTGPAGPGVEQGQPGHSAALAEIARRYAISHGPVTAADLARWTTLGLRQCVSALDAAVELTGAADYAVDTAQARVPLVRAVAEGSFVRGCLRVLGAGERPAQTEILYLRADLPDLLAASRRQARGTHFLGAFDELHVGYKDRSCLTDQMGEKLICPASNGMFRPILVDRGRVVAVRPVGEGLLWADGVRRSARLERDVERAVTSVQQRLSQD